MIGLDEAIADFIHVDRDAGFGIGSGGSGDGYGYGSCCYGFGAGNDYCSGPGGGCGNSFGNGFSSVCIGSGYCNGSGPGGYGYGTGADSGDIKNIYGAQVHIIDGMPTIIRSIHGNAAAGGVLGEDLSLRRCYVVKGGGFFAHGETLREAQESLERKILNNMPTAERIAEFIGRFEPGKKYPARLYYDWHHILTGSCKMGREAFARDHGYDLDKDELTPEEFMELTKDAYGGSVIRELLAAWTRAAMGPAGPGKGD